MSEFLAKTYYGNTVKEWAIALAIMVVAALVGKTLYWFFKNVLRKLTAKTKTNLDDIILDMVEEPIVLATTILGLWVGFARLTFSEKVEGWITNGVQGLIILCLTWLVARLVDSLIRELLLPLAEKSENDLDDQLLPILRRTTGTAIWALGIVMALNNAGYNVGAVIAGLGIGGLAMAMAAKDTVSNVFGGFTIFTDRPFTINDRIRFGGFDGMVQEIGLRSTRIRTLAGTLVTVPNAKFADSPVENVTAEPSRKVVLELGLTYDMSADQIEEALTTLNEIAVAHENVEEKVITGFSGFGDFSLNLLFIYYIKAGSDYVGVQTAINLEILRQFGDKGLEMAFPTQTILHQAIVEAS